MTTLDPPAIPAPPPSAAAAAGWTVQLRRADRRPMSVSLASLDGVVSSELTRACVADLPEISEEVSRPRQTALGDLERRSGEAAPGWDAMALWAPRAVEGWLPTSLGRPVIVEDGLGWVDQRGQLVSVARHDESVVAFALPRGVTEWRVSYRPAAAEAARVRRLSASLRLGWRGSVMRSTQQRIFEFPVYAGGNTTVVSGEVGANRRARVDHAARAL
jgi:hypothetical protein